MIVLTKMCKSTKNGGQYLVLVSFKKVKSGKKNSIEIKCSVELRLLYLNIFQKDIFFDSFVLSVSTF